MEQVESARKAGQLAWAADDGRREGERMDREQGLAEESSALKSPDACSRPTGGARTGNGAIGAAGRQPIGHRPALGRSWTHVTVRFDRLGGLPGMANAKITLDNGVQSASHECSLPSPHSLYSGGNIYIGSYKGGGARVKMRNLVFRRTWE